jgi:hypothetical protein
MLLREVLPSIFLRGVFRISSYSNNKKPITFRIVDSAMGVGKSQCLIDHIRFSESYCHMSEKNNRYIIFVPTLSERDERFRKRLGVKTPADRPYSQSIRDMIRDGDNIITTHALWNFFNDDTIKAFKQSKYRYAAYFDEVPGLFRDVVGSGLKPDENGNVVRFGSADVKLMQDQKMVACRNGVIQYNPTCKYAKEVSEYKVFNAVRSLSRSCTLYPYGEKDGQFTSIVAFAKRELFECFRQCWFFSYMTHNSMLHKYCVLNHIDMEYYQVNDGRFVKNPEGRYMETYPEGIGNLVILDDPRFNVDFSLSKNWYERAGKEKTRGKLKQLENCFRYAYEYMRSKGVRSDTFVYTVFNAYKDLIKSDGRHFPTAKRFLPCNTKATNDYSNCIGVAYLCNRYFDVTCTNFLAQRAKEEDNPELEFDNNNYALSELVQFIWRSHVRVKDSCQPVYVWVPDRRMRTLLQDFQKRALEGDAAE